MKKIVLVLSVFAIGFVSGAITMNVYRMVQFSHMRKAPHDLPGTVHSFIARELSLTPEQSAEVKRILDESKPKMDGLREATHREAEQIFDESFREISKILDEPRIKKLEAFRERMRRNAPPPPPPFMEEHRP